MPEFPSVIEDRSGVHVDRRRRTQDVGAGHNLGAGCRDDIDVTEAENCAASRKAGHGGRVDVVENDALQLEYLRQRVQLRYGLRAGADEA